MTSRRNLNRNISRIETGSTRGYEVRVMRRGTQVCKHFSDRQWGGKRKALAAAREYRDNLVTVLAGREISRKERARAQRSSNQSGIVGVRYTELRDSRGENEYVYAFWEAQWSPRPGVRKTRRFSINKYGDEKAKRMAIQARKKGVSEMDE